MRTLDRNTLVLRERWVEIWERSLCNLGERRSEKRTEKVERRVENWERKVDNGDRRVENWERRANNWENVDFRFRIGEWGV